MAEVKYGLRERSPQKDFKSKEIDKKIIQKLKETKNSKYNV